jgi:hypothetical protein
VKQRDKTKETNALRERERARQRQRERERREGREGEAGGSDLVTVTLGVFNDLIRNNVIALSLEILDERQASSLRACIHARTSRASAVCASVRTPAHIRGPERMLLLITENVELMYSLHGTDFNWVGLKQRTRRFTLNYTSTLARTKLLCKDPRYHLRRHPSSEHLRVSTYTPTLHTSAHALGIDTRIETRQTRTLTDTKQTPPCSGAQDGWQNAQHVARSSLQM